MLTLRKLALAISILMVASTMAFADHMNGRYEGSGDAAGTMLDLRQSGRQISGTLSGTTQGTIEGQSDGQDNASGTVNINGVGQLQFQLLWSQAGIELKLQGPGGSESYTFRSAGVGQMPQTTQIPTTPVPPVQQVPPMSPDQGTEYFIGQNGRQMGPLSRDQVMQGLQDGQFTPSDLVWKTGMPNWVQIQSIPELAPPPKGPPPLPPGASNGPPSLPTGGDGAGTPGPMTDNTGTAPTRDQMKISAIMLGSTLGILAHELGHAMIGELKIPATGAEEDTADEFSALIMASMVSDPTMPADQRNFVTDVVAYSTLLWHYDALQSKKQNMSLPWYDEHSASETRFRNTLCMIYGSSPALFGFVADRVQLPERERARCEVDYPKRYRAWETIVQPYARNLGGEFPGEQAADAPGGKVSVVYEQSANRFGQVLQTEFQNLGLFEGLAAVLSEILVWERDVKIVFTDCGVANAFYDPDQGKVVMCWEGLEYFFWIVAEAEGVPRNMSL